MKNVDLAGFRRDVLSWTSFRADIDNYTVDWILRSADIGSLEHLGNSRMSITTRSEAHDLRWLTDEARAAKWLSRHLERRFKKTQDEGDHLVHRSFRRDAYKKISESRAANIHDEMNAATGNPKFMWKVAREVLHQDLNSVDMDDAECRRMTTLLSDIFTKKLDRIWLSVNPALLSMTAFVTFPVWGFCGRTFDKLHWGDGRWGECYKRYRDKHRRWTRFQLRY